MSGHIATSNSSTINHTNGTSSSMWNSSKALLGKDVVKDKATLFKSQKYIRDYKGASIISGNNDSIIKKEEPK